MFTTKGFSFKVAVKIFLLSLKYELIIFILYVKKQFFSFYSIALIIAYIYKYYFVCPYVIKKGNYIYNLKKEVVSASFLFIGFIPV